MLNMFRENLRHLKWVLWIVAISMTLYLGSFFFGGSGGGAGGTWAAKVDGTEIPAQDLFNLTRNLDAQYRQLFGDNYTGDLRGSLQLGTRAMDTLIDRQVILDDASRMGLSASAEDVARAIREDPSFKDADGNFIGTDRYRELLSRFGGVGAFEARLAEDLVIGRWEQLLAESVVVTEAEMQQLFRERTEKTRFDYVVVNSADQSGDEPIGDEAVAAWYEEHRDDYRRPERRRIRYVVVDRESQRPKAVVTDEEIAAFYEANQSNYDFPEQRAARHILLRVAPDATPEEKEDKREQAENLLERLRNGEDFAKLAKEFSDDTISAERGGDLGMFGRGQMVPEFEQAVFSTPPGELAPVTETQFGMHVIEVTDAREAGVTPLAEVSDAIRRSLEAKRAQELTEAEAQRLAAEIPSAARLPEVAASEGLEIHSRLVTKDEQLGDLNPGPEFLTRVFELQPGSVSEALRVLAGFAIVTVDEVVPPGIAPLDEVADQVRTDVADGRARERALRRAEEALAAGSDVAGAAKRLGLEVQDSGDLAPNASLPATGGLSADARASLFGDAVMVGDRGVLEVPAGALVYQVTSREPFDHDRYFSEQPTLREELENRQLNRLRQALVERLREASVVEINQALVERFNS